MNFLLRFIIFFFFIPSLVYSAEAGGHSSSGESSQDKKIPFPPAKPSGPKNINSFLHGELNHLTKAKPPYIWDRKLIFTYDKDPEARYAAVAFAHELFRKKHLFFKNQNHVFFLVLDVLEEWPQQLEYRFIVDGLWKIDPENPRQAFDKNHVLFSQIQLSEKDRPKRISPMIRQGKLEFYFKGRSGLKIAVIGNFNAWDPFTHFLEEEMSHLGNYKLELDLPEGPLFYQYVIGTKTILDPLNPQVGSDEHGGLFSYFEYKNHTQNALSILEDYTQEAEKSHTPQTKNQDSLPPQKRVGH